ncbi:MAG: polysaccharide deacetylase family protein [Syntrophobacteraceae bacterium]
MSLTAIIETGACRWEKVPRMLLILAYHRAVKGRYGNPLPVLRAHFEYIHDRFPVVVPGEALCPHRLNLCLTFDDAFVDFYSHVFPMLREFSLRAVLAVPTAFILESSGLALEERLSVSHEDAMQGDVFREKAPFCTWQELGEMATSGLVHIASHSHSHCNMINPATDLELEIRHSKAILGKNLNAEVTTFVYPYGKVNGVAHHAVRKHYPYAMRLGSALNWDWTPSDQPLCRVPSDETPDIKRFLQWNRLLSYRLKWVANGVRAGLGRWRPRRAECGGRQV